MSNKMICPVCDAGKVLAFPDGTFACDNEYCTSYNETDTTAYNLLIQAKLDLEQSEKCCSAWETQALDYKAETIALSGKLEIVTEALEKIKSEYNRCRRDEFEGEDIDWEWWAMAAKNVVETALKQIEHKDEK